MKKTLAILISALLLMTMVMPAFAITGVSEDPGLPTIGVLEEDPFGIAIQLVENEPNIIHDEYGFEINEWIPIDNATPFNVGDTVTFVVSYTVPAEVGGYAEEMLSNVELVLGTTGLTEFELVEATGCVRNTQCNYEIGICYPAEGYENAYIDENSCIMYAYENSDVTVVLRGKIEGAVTLTLTETIGQYELPARFSLGTLTIEELSGNKAYMIHHVDTFNVIKRDVYFVANADNSFNSLVVGLESHAHNGLYVVDPSMTSITPLEGGEAITEGELFDIVIDAAQTRMDLFGFSFANDGILTDGVFLMASEPVQRSFEQEIVVNGTEPDPTEEPDPTDAPVDPDPTDAPVNPDPTDAPDDPTPPVTGDAAWTYVAIGAVVIGVAVAIFAGVRRAKKN